MTQQCRMEHEDADSTANEMQQCTKTITGGKKALEQQQVSNTTLWLEDGSWDPIPPGDG